MGNRSRTWKVLALVMIFALIASACGAASVPTPAATQTARVVEVTKVVEKQVQVPVEVTKVVEKQVQVPVEVTRLVVAPTFTPAPTPALVKPSQPLVVTLGWLNNDEFAPLQVAQAKGFYAAAGFPNVLLLSGGGSTGNNPILTVQGFDEAQKIGVPAALSLMIMAHASAGVDTIAVAALTQKDPTGFATLGPSAANGPCDFAGKVVAVQTDGDWIPAALGKVCNKGALVPGKDFTKVPAGYTPDCLLLPKGNPARCDYYCAWPTNQVYGLAQQKLEYSTFLVGDYLPFYYADVIAVSKAWAAKNPDKVKAFVRASMQGLQYTIDHPDEAAQISSQNPGVELAHAQWRLPIQNKMAVSPDTQQNGLGYFDLKKVQAMIDFMASIKMIDKSFPASEIVSNAYLPGVLK